MVCCRVMQEVDRILHAAASESGMRRYQPSDGVDVTAAAVPLQDSSSDEEGLDELQPASLSSPDDEDSSEEE